MDNPALDAILLGVDDPRQREAITRAYFDIAQGDPTSFPVVFGLVINSAVRSIAESAAKFQTSGNGGLDPASIDAWAEEIAKRIEEKSPSYEDLKRVVSELKKPSSVALGSDYLTPSKKNDGALPVTPLQLSGIFALFTAINLAGIWLILH